jgi:hypothetical protein
MSKCTCGYCTESRDEFVGHIANGWDDLRIDHSAR